MERHLCRHRGQREQGLNIKQNRLGYVLRSYGANSRLRNVVNAPGLPVRRARISWPRLLIALDGRLFTTSVGQAERAPTSTISRSRTPASG